MSVSAADKRARAWLRADWGLLVAALGLSLVGCALIWSSTHRAVGSALVLRQLIFLVAGMIGAAVLTQVDVARLRAWAPWLYLAGTGGLVLLLTPLGVTVNGSRSWIHLPGGLSVQPAELAKLALVLGLAVVLAESRDPQRLPSTRELAWAAIIVGVPVGLVMLQPDLGSALVVLALSAAVVIGSGISWRWVAAGVAGAAAAVAAVLALPILKPYQRARLLVFIQPDADPGGIGYQTQQARLAIGSGGWAGQGLGQGKQTQGGFIPFQSTDFVFTVAGEELGFLGAGVIVLVLAFVVLRVVLVALGTDEPFARLAALGVAGWFTFQTFENIGMCLGLMPVTGLPLPFVSYGGSSLLSCWLAVGLVSSVRR